MGKPSESSSVKNTQSLVVVFGERLINRGKIDSSIAMVGGGGRGGGGSGSGARRLREVNQSSGT